jgi:hypothetical protein
MNFGSNALTDMVCVSSDDADDSAAIVAAEPGISVNEIRFELLMTLCEQTGMCLRQAVCLTRRESVKEGLADRINQFSLAAKRRVLYISLRVQFPVRGADGVRTPGSAFTDLIPDKTKAEPGFRTPSAPRFIGSELSFENCCNRRHDDAKVECR